VSFNHVVLSFRSHRISEVSNTRMNVMKKRSRKHRRRREVNLAYFNSFLFYLLSSTTDLAHKLEDAKNEIQGMPFTFYFTVLLSSSTLELKKELSEGFHKFLNTELPTGMCFFLCSLHFLIRLCSERNMSHSKVGAYSKWPNYFVLTSFSQFPQWAWLQKRTSPQAPATPLMLCVVGR